MTSLKGLCQGRAQDPGPPSRGCRRTGHSATGRLGVRCPHGEARGVCLGESLFLVPRAAGTPLSLVPILRVQAPPSAHGALPPGHTAQSLVSGPGVPQVGVSSPQLPRGG